MSVATPRPASTVVVIRQPAAGAPLEALMVRRNDKVAFMAGAYVFPGGRVDEHDAVADPSTCCDGLDALPHFPDLTADEELPYRVAAIRELEEEAAVLLARTADGAIASQDVAARVRAAMGPSHALPEAVRREGLRLALDEVIPLAHWVTPEVEIRRYDTRFFLARMPDGQDARHDAGETTEFAWMTPETAIARCRAGEIMLPPPTWTTLKWLARFASVDEAFAWARTKPIVRVQPGFVKEETGVLLILPGDPTYPAMPGWDVPEETRFMLEEGKGWRPVTP